MYGERIRARREALGFSLKKLASLIETPVKDIALWESEQKPPSIPELISLSKALIATVDWLVGASDENMYDEEFDLEEFFGEEFEEYFDDEFDEDEEDLDEDEEGDEEDEYENFVRNEIIPHMKYFASSNNDAAYIHVQLTDEGSAGDCVIYTGSTDAVLSCINLLIRSLSKEAKINYYDLVSFMATANAELDMGKPLGGNKEDQ